MTKLGICVSVFVLAFSGCRSVVRESTNDDLSTVAAPQATPTLATPTLATPTLATPTLATPTLATPTLATPNASNRISLEDFFRNPALNLVRVSPDGQTLALLKSWKNRMNVFVMPRSNPSAIKQLTFIKDRDIGNVEWKGNDFLLFQKDTDGDENEHVFAVNVKTLDTRDLTPIRGVKASLVETLEESSPSDILIGTNERNRELFDVYRVNVQTGLTKMVAENTNKITSWLVDHLGNPRGGIASDGINSVFYFQKSPGQPFTELFKTDFRNTFNPIAFTADNAHIFVETNLNRDLTVLAEVDPQLPAKNGRFIVRTLFAHPKYDLGDAHYSLKHKDIGPITVVTDRRETQFRDPQDQSDWEYLRGQLDNQYLLLASTSRDERVWVVKTLTDRTRGEYFAFDRSTRTLTLIGKLSPWLQIAMTAEMKTIHYKTRDGLEIEGYLTLPPGREAVNLPVVVNPHGGPWARDEWHFNPETQFLASRGYAVLQMNFRGSTSYGRKFWEASFKQWGGRMQDDISDGVKWLTESGIADPKRIGIYGGSYGGYATLAGLAFSPDLYACGVDYVGVSNLFTFIKTIPPYWRPFLDMMYAMVGDPVKDKAILAARSPALHADKIRAPLFVAQGKNDPRVNKAESDQMVEALRKRGIQVEYMVKNNEGHGFHNEENRFDFYRAMEKFLAKHLGGLP